MKRENSTWAREHALGRAANPDRARARETLNKNPGKFAGPEPADEREHFMQCPECGQWFDMRRLGDAFHHDEPGHAPLPAN